MAENCSNSAVTFTLPEGEATDSNSSLQRMLIKGHRMSLKHSILDVDVDSEHLQNRYVETESHLLQSTANDIRRLINDHLFPSEVTQAIGRLLSGENCPMRHFLVHRFGARK